MESKHTRSIQTPLINPTRPQLCTIGSSLDNIGVAFSSDSPLGDISCCNLDVESLGNIGTTQQTVLNVSYAMNPAQAVSVLEPNLPQKEVSSFMDHKLGDS